MFPQLATWLISGNASRTKKFLSKVQSYCLHHGDRSLQNHTTHYSENGLTGAINDTSILFQEISEVVNCLAHLFKEGYQYRVLNTYRSAISSVHEKVDGYEVRHSPLVSRVLKVAFNQCPPKPRYEFTRDVSKVLNYIDSLGESDALPLQRLS